MTTMTRFPILMTVTMRRDYPDMPTSVPWDLVRPHEQRAVSNHNQNLRRLAERGGLSPEELLCLLTDAPLAWRVVRSPATIMAELRKLGVGAPDSPHEGETLREAQQQGHGHVTRRADGVVTRCGGPRICPVCQKEAAAKNG